MFQILNLKQSKPENCNFLILIYFFSNWKALLLTIVFKFNDFQPKGKHSTYMKIAFPQILNLTAIPEASENCVNT